MANLARYIPSIPRVSRLEPFRDLEEMMDRFWMRPTFGEKESLPSIRLDMTENDQVYKVYAEIPGVKKEDINVAVEGNQVFISADVKEEAEKKDGDKMIWRERYQGHESRSFTLDCEVDESKAVAKYADGVLQLTLPKKSGGAISKQLKIM